MAALPPSLTNWVREHPEAFFRSPSQAGSMGSVAGDRLERPGHDDALISPATPAIGDQSGGIPPAMQATVKSLTAAAQEVQKAIQAGATEAEKISRFMSTAVEHAHTVASVQEASAKALKDAHEGTDQGVSGKETDHRVAKAPEDGQTPPGDGQTPGAPPQAQQPAQGQQVPSGTGETPGSTAPTSGGRHQAPSQGQAQRAAQIGQTYAQLRNTRSVGGLMRMGAGALSKRMSEWSPGQLTEMTPEEIQNADTSQAAPGSGGTIYKNKETGEVATDPNAVSQHETTQQHAQSLKGLIGGLGSGQGVAGTLEGIASGGGQGEQVAKVGAGVLGGLGAIGGIGGEVASKIQSQRAQNAYWQRITGGSNFSGFGQRLQEKGFELGNIFTMSPQQSNQLFQGASEMGLTGTDRNQALNEGLELYKKFGMTVQQSLQLMSISAMHGNTSFQSLTQTLDKVTQSAKEAGVNTDTARQNFASLYNSAASVMGGTGGGGGAAGIAGAQSQVLSALGREFQNVNLGGLNSPQGLNYQAAEMGIPLGQYQARLRQPANPNQINPSQSTGSILAAQGQQKQILTDINSASNGMFRDPQWQQFVQSHKGQQIDPANPDLQRVMEQLQSKYNVDQQTLESVLQSQGITGIDPAQVLNVAGSLAASAGQGGAAGQGFLVQQAIQSAQRSQPTAITNQGARARAEVTAGLPGGAAGTTSAGGSSGFFATHQNQLDAAQKAYEQSFLTNKKLGQATGQKGATGERSPIIEQLLANDRSQKIEVSTTGGKRVVGLDEAIKYYSDQLQSGTASIASTGQSVTQATGVAAVQNPQTGYKTGSAEDQSKGKQGKGQIGQTEDQYKKSSGKGGGGTLVVEAGPGLQNLIKMTGYGNVYVDPSQSGNNAPSTNANPSPAYLNPGSGG